MTQYAISSDTVWPSANDVASVTGGGKILKELAMRSWRLGTEQNYVISGFKVPLSSANLDLSVPLGIACVGGYYVEVTGSTTITTVNGTTYLYLALTRDGSNKVTGAVFDRLSSPNDVADYCLIAVLIASGGAITDTIDARRVSPFSGPFSGPHHTPTGSTYGAEGFSLANSNTSYGGTHIYQSFRLKAGVTLSGNRSLICIMADRVIEIAGTIAGQYAGGAGGAAATVGTNGTDQAGGGGGGDGTTSGGAGGGAIINGIVQQQGGASATGTAPSATVLTGIEVMRAMDVLRSLGGGAGGGGGRNGGAGGNGGASIVLIAPVVILKATAVLNSSGQAGSNSGGGNGGGGGGGGAGNIWIICKQNWFIDEGATFTKNGGAPGSLTGSGGNGGNGAAGTLQILTYL